MNSVATRMIPVSRPSFGTAEEAAIIDVLRSGWVTQGPKVAEFESKFAEYVGAAHAIAVSSCTTALHLALIAAGIRSGDEVLCPSLSFIATANAIVHTDGVPVFIDIDEATYNMDPNRIERAITSRTKAILVVHQIGLPAALDEINEIANRRGLIVIEDAACAIGAEYKGRRIGAPHSLMACFSFHPRKILTAGEGGMITTADTRLAARLRKLRQHAMSMSDVTRHSSATVMIESYDEVGYNYRLTDLQAAVGLVQLKRLDDLLARRRALAERYSSELSSIPWIATPCGCPESLRNFQSYMIRLTGDAPVSRDDLMQELLDRGVSSRRGIMAIHRELPYQSTEWDSQLPVTNRVTDTAIVLPLFHGMANEEQNYVIDCIRQIGESAAARRH
ncbi:MAG TPA: DegT/DnrJ/EryC1/StrS family aminotransferase [Bryobacteraceae bacterium]|nr:DegT/DnrJ/EryC1/StrS family aminotransferase [Bryobacteraceae bacterium]